MIGPRVRGLEGGWIGRGTQSGAVAEDGATADPVRARPCGSGGTPKTKLAEIDWGWEKEMGWRNF